MTTAPFEILYGPGKLYTGPVDEARPDLEDAPAGNWTLLGTLGDKEYAEDGVVLTPEQTIEEFFGLGSTAPQKAHRAQERFTITVTLHDMTAENFAIAMNSATVTDTAPGAGTAGVRDFDLLRGLDVTEIGVLFRVERSPYIAAAASQFWVPRCYVAEVNEISYMKDTPAGYEIVFAALESSSNGFGKYEAEDAVAS